MTLSVFSEITPLPERASGTKPDADGELWNTRYTEVNLNFELLEGGSAGEFWAAGGGWSVPAGTGITNGHVIQDEGTPLTQRANLDFIGPIVQAADGGTATAITINGDARHPVKYTGKTAAPAVTDDGTAGYLIGDRWIDETNDAEYVCLDITTGAAIWTETTAGGGSYDLAADIHAATDKATPVDADELGIWDSVSAALRKLTWANVKATLKTYFDSLYLDLITYDPTNVSGDAFDMDNMVDGTTNKVLTTGTQTISGDKTVSSLKSYAEAPYTITASASPAISRANGGIQVLTLDQNATISEDLATGESVTLHLNGGSTYTVTWFTVTWVGGSAPTLTANDVLEFWAVGSTIYGAYVGSVA